MFPKKAKVFLKLAQVLLNCKSSVFHVVPCTRLVQMTSSGVPIPSFIRSLPECLPLLGLLIWIVLDPVLLRPVYFFLQGDLQPVVGSLLGLFVEPPDHHLILNQPSRKAFVVCSPRFRYFVCMCEDFGSSLLAGFLLLVHCCLYPLPRALCLSKSSESEEDGDSSPPSGTGCSFLTLSVVRRSLSRHYLGLGRLVLSPTPKAYSLSDVCQGIMFSLLPEASHPCRLLLAPVLGDLSDRGRFSSLQARLHLQTVLEDSIQVCVLWLQGLLLECVNVLKVASSLSALSQGLLLEPSNCVQRDRSI